MVTCSNCGQANRDGQRFCGNCGTEMPVAAPPPRAVSVADGQPSPYAYTNQQQPAYPGYDRRQPANGQSPVMRFIVIGAIVLFVACCMFFCGLVFGFEVIPAVFGGGTTPTPRPIRTPTPAGMLPMIVSFFI